jgi:hypothetical protein
LLCGRSSSKQGHGQGASHREAEELLIQFEVLHPDQELICIAFAGSAVCGKLRSRGIGLR